MNLRDYPITDPDPVPAGWLTAAQHAVASDLSSPQARARLKILVDRGDAEMRKFKIRSGQRVYPVPHYKLK